MNKTIRTFLLTGDKFILELHLKQPGFTSSACGPLNKHREGIQKYRETGKLKHLYRNELGKACFPHDATYFDSKGLANRTISDKILKDRPRNCKYDRYQRALASMAYKFFDEKTELGVSVNQQLAEELHKPIIKTFKKRKIYWRFKEYLGRIFSWNGIIVF